MIDKVQETHLYKWLCEKNSEFLGQVNEAIGPMSRFSTS